MPNEQRNKGGRPRKDSSEKKLHRVQIAMSDAQLADARRLAQLQDTSVSAAVANAVPIALQQYTRRVWLEDMVQGLRDAAKRVARESIDRGGAVTNEVMESMPDVNMFALISFVHTESQCLKMRTDHLRAYEDAIKVFADNIAKSHEGAGLQFDNARQPFDWSKHVAVFAFLDGDNATERLYYYGQPFGTSAESPQSGALSVMFDTKPDKRVTLAGLKRAED